jgi:hypothetical protein
MFVACDGSGLYRTEDAGATWSLVDQAFAVGKGHLNLPTGYGFSVAFHPLRPQILAINTNGQIVESSDGVSWSPLGSQPGGNATACAMDGGDMIAVARDDGSVSIQNGAGAAWATPTGLTAGATIIGIDFASYAAGPSDLFVATTADVYVSFGGTSAWQALGTGGVAAGAFANVTGFAVAASGTHYSVYAVVQSPGASVPAPVQVYKGSQGSAGVLASAMGSGGAATTVWVSGSLPALFNNQAIEYGLIATTRPSPSVVYVTGLCVGAAPGDRSTAIWISTNGARTWTGICHGFQTVGSAPDPACNIAGGWLDFELGGWTFGPSPFGIAVDSNHPTHALFTSEGAVYATSIPPEVVQSRTPLPDPRPLPSIPAFPRPTWFQRYTGQTVDPTPPSMATPVPKPGPTRSIGLEVTTAWDYFIDKVGNHYICYTDIGLCRSTDEGATWSVAPPDAQGMVWNNCYQLTQSGSTLYAAVSALHDIPVNTPLNALTGQWKGQHAGTVLASTDSGASWKPILVDATGNPLSMPVTSVQHATVGGTSALFATVFDDGSGNVGGVWYLPDGQTTWTQWTSGFASPNPACYRLAFDGQALYCSVLNKSPSGDLGGGGTIYAATTVGGPFSPLPPLLTAASATPLNPIDLTVRTTGSGITNVYVGTFASLGSAGGAGRIATVFKLSGSSWLPLWSASSPPDPAAFPNWFGAYPVGGYLYITSDKGTWRAPLQEIDQVGPAGPYPTWTPVPLPYRRTQRIFSSSGPVVLGRPTEMVRVSTFGYGVMAFPHTPFTLW